ncbi:bifunctional 2-polyprenyl-6-hydroxyphenol methylase/3-demethylubiquinol 3-O-methyltransferase UbiG [Gracilinema caldarium]|uniref:class I SAM-dependent methyltransferase n=1 Tax=Gracilinema caldarium TaxID=215591 RepID=UPI0026EFFC7E|nr:methyltransferase domain-containing protein [Gracilinema caldarium]
MRDIKTWSTPVIHEQKQRVPCILCGSDSFVPALDCEGFSYVRCRVCSLVQQNPQPRREAIEARYGDLSSQAYLEYELANEGAFLTLQQKGLADGGFFDLEPDILRQQAEPPLVLDIGCATGALLEWLRDRGWDCLGVELCGPAADYARQVRKLNIITGTIESAKLSDNSVTVALASHVIEHVNNPKTFVSEIYRCLKVGGYFYITTPNIDGFQARLFGSRWRSAIFDHLYLFSKKTLRALLEDAEFIVEKIVSWGGLARGTAPGPIKHMADRLAKRFNWGDVVLMRCRKVSAQ